MTTVLHYVQRWLPVSSGFVHAQIRRSRHRGVVLSREAIENGEDFPHRPLWSLNTLLSRTPPVARTRLLTLSVVTVAAATRSRLVHVHFGYPLLDVAPAARRLRLPLVVSLHGHDTTALPREAPGFYEPVIDQLAAVVVPSRYLAAEAEGFGVAARRIHVIPAGVDTSWFSPSPLPGGAEVVFVGRLVEKKGLDILLAAWPAVLSACPTARLRVIGDGPLQHLLADRGPSVVVEPPEPGRRAVQVRDALRAASVVVQPSRTAAGGDAESMLLVNLEAQASARPVVTTRHGGIPEFVAENETALLVEEGDAEALAAAVIRVLSDRSLACALGEAGPAFARRFSVERGVAELDLLYDRLAGNGPR